MIYIKIKSDLYNITDFWINAKYKRKLKAVNRVINNTVKKYVSHYPDIDIVLETRQVKNKLGRFYGNTICWHMFRNRERKEKINPLMVLYINNIIYRDNPVKLLIQVLTHEFIHFKQWLTNDSYIHGKKLPAKVDDGADLDSRIKLHVNQLREEV